MSERDRIADLLEAGDSAGALRRALAMGDASDIRWVLDNGASLSEHRRPLAAAVSRGKDPVRRARAVLEHGAEVDTDALNTAARRMPEERALETVRFLVERGNVDLNTPDRFGWTPLTHAVATENMLLTRYLLERGAADTMIVGDAENTGNYAPGSSIRDLAATVDEFQQDQDFFGPGQDGPGGFRALLEEAWGPAESDGIEGRWRCIAYRIDHQTTAWREDDLGRGTLIVDADGSFVFDTMFSVSGEHDGGALRIGGLDVEVEEFAAGQSLAIRFPAFGESDEHLGLVEFSHSTFYFRRDR